MIRICKNVKPVPLYCRPQINFYPGGGRLTIMASSKTVDNQPLEDVEVITPLPNTVDSVKAAANQGTVEFNSSTKVSNLSMQFYKL